MKIPSYLQETIDFALANQIVESKLDNAPITQKSIKSELPNNFPPLITLYGYKRSGKDIAAEWIHENYSNVLIRAWSDAIMDDVNEYIDIQIDQTNKVHPPYRRVLEDWARWRVECDNNFWIKRAQLIFDKAKENNQRLILTGARDNTECDWVRENNGEVWHVVRPSLEKDTNNHIREGALDKYDHFACVLKNDMEGNLQPFYSQIQNHIDNY